jgi:hypothetical protein
MTTPSDIRRLIRRVLTSANVADARLDSAVTSLTLRMADSLPNTASGADTGPRGNAELTPVEAAADRNLGDLYGYNGGTYKPGPLTQLDDLADELRAALKSMDRAHDALSTAGVPPFITEQYRCRGINSVGCPTMEYKDEQRSDHLCIECGRVTDSNARRLRRHRAAS